MSWIDLNIPDAPEGKLQLMSSLDFDLLGLVELGWPGIYFLAGRLTPVSLCSPSMLYGHHS